MRVFRPLPRSATRLVSVVVLIVWAAVMAALVNRFYIQASSVSLATDLARYGSTATWRGVYYRGEKIGFTVSQTVPRGDGFEIQEDGRLQMALLGATTPATIRTTALVDVNFVLRSFTFSIDPGTGPVEVIGRVDGRHLALTIKTSGSVRTEERDLDAAPALTQNLPRRLANGGLVAGSRHRWLVFDPATLQNSQMTVDVGRREIVRGASILVPAFRVETEFAGIRTTSWVTDTGEVVREESALGLMTVRESREQAQANSVSGSVQADMLTAAAVVPITKSRIDDPRDVRRLRVRIDGVDLPPDDLQGAGQSTRANIVDIIDAQTLSATTSDPAASRYLAPETFIESDDPAIRAEALIAVRGVVGVRDRAERLTRYVNGLLEKKPTVSLPSAREVLRTKVGDCNEHTALYVAMARALGIPSRVAVGLVYVRGAFYYHAWPEVYVEESGGRGLWLPVDPTLNEYPADATHVRLARGGLEKQAAILPLIGRLKMTILDLEVAPSSTRILAGKAAQ